MELDTISVMVCQRFSTLFEKNERRLNITRISHIFSADVYVNWAQRQPGCLRVPFSEMLSSLSEYA